MKDISRRYFVVGTARLFLAIGTAALLCVIAYVAIELMMGIFSIEPAAWQYLLRLVPVLVGVYLFNYGLKIALRTYEASSDANAKANVAALSAAMSALVIGFCAAMALRAYDQDHADNVVMWGIVTAFLIPSLFLDVRRKFLQRE